MSWGERSCKNRPCPIPDECSFETCNVNCRKYEWDGKTKPDSAKQETVEDAVQDQKKQMRLQSKEKRDRSEGEPGQFCVGQIVECNGRMFVVTKIMRKRMMLRLKE